MHVVQIREIMSRISYLMFPATILSISRPRIFSFQNLAKVGRILSDACLATCRLHRLHQSRERIYYGREVMERISYYDKVSWGGVDVRRDEEPCVIRFGAEDCRFHVRSFKVGEHRYRGAPSTFCRCSPWMRLGLNDVGAILLKVAASVLRELSAHFCGVLVRVEAGQQVHDVIWEFHDSLDSGSP